MTKKFKNYSEIFLLHLSIGSQFIQVSFTLLFKQLQTKIN